MRKDVRDKLEKWAIAYHKKPTIPRSPNQALAIEIHDLMSDGEWRTSKEIAAELKRSVHSVRDVMLAITVLWDYESSKDRNKGYRRKQ